MIIQKETDEHLWALCPNHDDTNASLCINKTNSFLGGYVKGYAYCYGCGHIMHFSEEAVNKMSNKKSICREKRPIDWESLWLKYFNNLDAVKVNVKLAEEWDINPCLFPCFHIGYDGVATTAPMRNENYDIIGIQRRFPDGSKRCVEGSQLGLFISNFYDDKPIIITEGLSDTMVATHLKYQAVGKPSAGFGEDLVRKYLQNIKYKGDIIICQDNDDAGRRSRVKLQMCLTDWNTRFVVPTTDLKDFYLKNGRNTTKQLLEM